jgi:hypothetical protein
MERRKKYLKLAAFVPAIVLVGGFVGCHAGAFSRFSKPEPKPEPALPTPEPAAPNPPNSPPVLMSGTKSLNAKGVTIGLVPADTATPDLDVPVRPQPQPAKPDSKPPLIIPGPKSAPVFTPSQPNSPTPP